MKSALKIIGVLLFVMGLVDVIGSYMDFDLWGGVFGIELPEVVWRYSAYLELLAGYLLFKAGKAAPAAAPSGVKGA